MRALIPALIPAMASTFDERALTRNLLAGLRMMVRKFMAAKILIGEVKDETWYLGT
jgi:hypothetical protein